MDNLNNAVNEYLNSSEKGRSLTRIGIKYKVKKQTLAKELKRRNVEIINYQNLTTVNETVFDVIDTEEKAYWLGFIFADGNIASAKKNLKLTLVFQTSNIYKEWNYFF